MLCSTSQFKFRIQNEPTLEDEAPIHPTMMAHTGSNMHAFVEHGRIRCGTLSDVFDDVKTSRGRVAQHVPLARYACGLLDAICKCSPVLRMGAKCLLLRSLMCATMHARSIMLSWLVICIPSWLFMCIPPSGLAEPSVCFAVWHARFGKSLSSMFSFNLNFWRRSW